MSDPDLPIALRPVGEFPLGSGSIFEDPGDEKSWHQSQRAESLERFYEGREASWYASAIRPLAGAERVLDLGCGPGLTLQALLDQGAGTVLGVDRWSNFALAAAASTPIVVHDLTLPMPFLGNASFDAVLSHYALDYVSPIGMRQVLREAHRVLDHDGRLLIYVAAIGMGSGDETRTIPYGAEAMRALLAEAGFADITVECSPNGRNTVAAGRRAEELHPPEGLRCDRDGAVATDVSGEIQLDAGFAGVEGECLEVVATGQPEATLRFDLPAAPGDGRLGVCVRVTTPAADGAELQVWAWQDGAPVVAESLRLEALPVSLHLRADGALQHSDVWSPQPLALEPAGSAYLPASEVDDASSLDEAARGAEGRLIVVEEERLDRTGIVKAIGVGRNRFLIRRAGLTSIATLDRDWLEGVALGVAVEARRLSEDEGAAIGRWAGARQALLVVEGEDWEEIETALRPRIPDLTGPVLLVDPELRGGVPRPPGEDLAALAREHSGVYLVLGANCRESCPERLLGPLGDRVLRGGPRGDRRGDEALRLLTERALLMRLRRASRRPPHELGRRLSLA